VPWSEADVMGVLKSLRERARSSGVALRSQTTTNAVPARIATAASDSRRAWCLRPVLGMEDDELTYVRKDEAKLHGQVYRGYAILPPVGFRPPVPL